MRLPARRDRLGRWALTNSPLVAWAWLCLWGVTGLVAISAVVTGVVEGRIDSMFWFSVVYTIVGARFVWTYGANVIWLRRGRQIDAEKSE